MLVACRLAGLSALEGHYGGVRAQAQFGPTEAGLARALAGSSRVSGGLWGVVSTTGRQGVMGFSRALSFVRRGDRAGGRIAQGDRA
jgi:hypothetical protein